MTTPSDPVPAPGFGTRLGRAFRVFLRALARLLLILLVVALIGLALYYGVPAAYRGFIQPVRDNTQRLGSLQATQAQVDQQLSQNLVNVQGRLGTLEAQHASDAQMIATLQVGVNSMVSSSGDTVNQLKASTARLDALDASIKQISLEMTAITTTLTTDKTAIQVLTDKIQAGDPAIKPIYQELMVLKSMELITRSRLFLGQNNLGLAQQDIQAAYDLLGELQNQVPPYQTGAVSAVVQRLKLSLGNLPDAPVLAADDLEIAWQLLVRGLPSQTPEAVSAGGSNQFATPTTTTSITSTITLTITPAAIFTSTTTLTITSTARFTPAITITSTPLSTSLFASATATP